MNTISIDFGTGNSILAEWAGTRAAIFHDIGENGAVCSDIVIDNDGKFITNPSCYKELQIDTKMERFVKRRLISALESGDDENILYLAELISEKLKYIYDTYCRFTNEKVVKTVLTCPANTGQKYRNVLLEIGRKIGLPSVDIVDEPTAAAVHHGLSEIAQHNERWLVIDWGCGTYDVSLIKRIAGSRDLQVVCVKGDNSLGGMDMDNLLAEHLATAFRFDADAVQPYAVEKLKKMLSEEVNISAEVPLKNGNAVSITCSREELERIVEPLLAKGKSLIKEALQSVGWGDLDFVIATGGPIMMPCVRRMICEATDIDEDEILFKDPLTSVALGAARLAELKRVGGLVVTNQVTKSIGVRVMDGEIDDAYHIVINRGEDRPVRRSVNLATSVDLQDIIEIEIREGDNRASAQSNTLLARLNAVIRPDNKGSVQLKLQVALSDAGGIEFFLEPIGDKKSVRDIQDTLGLYLKQGQKEVVTGELRTGDPLLEFKTQVLERDTDPDTARQIYERLKIKYHPDRDPVKREHWNRRLAALDDAFNTFSAEVNRRMRAATVPDLPWDKPNKMNNLVDEALAHRLTHCIANGIGTEEERSKMTDLLKSYPDYRRVLASYLFGVKRNIVLQNMLAEDDRPHVGLVVLLQNIPGKPIHERHEVLKAAYRVEESKVRGLLQNPELAIESLYTEVPQIAETTEKPMGQQARPDIIIKHEGGNTYISGNTYPVKEMIKQAARNAGGRAQWDGQQWIIEGQEITEGDILG